MIKNSCMQKFIKNQLIYVDVMIKNSSFSGFLSCNYGPAKIWDNFIGLIIVVILL